MNTTKELCPKSMTIYHIKDKKVGSTSNIKQRLRQQGGYTKIQWEVLHEIEPNTMTPRAIWELECQEQARLGYQVENESHYQHFLRSNTNNSQQGKPRTESQKKAQSVAMSGQNHPMFGKHLTEAQKKANSVAMSGENNPMYGIKPAHAKAYNIFTLDGDLFAFVDDPVGLAKQHGIPKDALRNCANPNHTRRHIKINNTKYTVEYATEE